MRLPSQAADTIAIALGANLADPFATLAALRPLLVEMLEAQAPKPIGYHWSPLFRTEPVGGPAGQPPYLNAVLLLGPPLPPLDPLELLQLLQALETRFGRQRLERWGPRHLDLDLLWCGATQVEGPELQLPHPRLLERSFVLAPMAAIAPELVPPGQDPKAPGLDCAALLEKLLPQLAEAPPERLPAAPGWPA
ncbi:2-amino-4-hydroxy-6-hydroxymethyldihydropteridine diphosphokinase [Cyanobium sp. HWJ4-Hawea]|uniref:2-amino-4-hydroxy-6- hydroxymethyldihydropteridine diphosphokinase n=1 Tax=Cyanobium sp. HWJ4-Hawea TaxID=2823713 RepID=UPI0020CD1CF9|nr:2-amino-4-hydroxy-6-hydroxymethyldihydropteridine diphosphokinase [Cyanobium sp. HWJ4-Hawea]MCP9808347.1 2-amino-4-hydroxy-6-hydroxymethyldihydropteridine diphosphokinase [Cyanobium sp. HWJ4-Hawea]